jgi:hypothetical protein
LPGEEQEKEFTSINQKYIFHWRINMHNILGVSTRLDNNVRQSFYYKVGTSFYGTIATATWHRLFHLKEFIFDPIQNKTWIEFEKEYPEEHQDG